MARDHFKAMLPLEAEGIQVIPDFRGSVYGFGPEVRGADGRRYRVDLLGKGGDDDVTWFLTDVDANRVTLGRATTPRKAFRAALSRAGLKRHPPCQQ